MIYLKKPNARIPYESFKYEYSGNKDGCGLVYAKNNELFISKGLFSFEKFLGLYQQIPSECPAIIHLRDSTEGNVNAANCHPFTIDKDHVFAHEGSFSCGGRMGMSDTFCFVQDYLVPLFKKSNKAWLEKDNEIDKAVERDWGRAVILDNKGNFRIFNESKGNWQDNVWYSH